MILAGVPHYYTLVCRSGEGSRRASSQLDRPVGWARQGGRLGDVPLGQKRTNASTVGLSAKCDKQTFR